MISFSFSASLVALSLASNAAAPNAMSSVRPWLNWHERQRQLAWSSLTLPNIL